MEMQSRHSMAHEGAETAYESGGGGRLWESFPEPAGWAAHWDGPELDRAMEMTDEGEGQQCEGTEQ